MASAMIAREMAAGEQEAGDDRPARAERSGAGQRADEMEQGDDQDRAAVPMAAAAGNAERPGRAQHQQIAQVPPAVAPRAQDGAGGREDRGQASPALRRCAVLQARLDHHLAGEFHAVAIQLERARKASRLIARRPQWASSIARAEEEVEDAGQRRIADIAVLPGHGAGGDAALEARAHAQIGALDQLADHRHGLAEIVGAVGVAEDEIAAARGIEPPPIRAAP